MLRTALGRIFAQVNVLLMRTLRRIRISVLSRLRQIRCAKTQNKHVEGLFLRQELPKMPELQLRRRRLLPLRLKVQAMSGRYRQKVLLPTLRKSSRSSKRRFRRKRHLTIPRRMRTNPTVRLTRNRAVRQRLYRVR